MQDQPVVRVAAEWLQDDLFELGFDVVHCLAGRKAGAVADAKHVRVDRKCFLAESCIQDNIGGLPADAGEFLQLFAGSRHLAAILVEERSAQRDDVLRLGVEQSDRFDRLAEPLLAEIDHLARGFDALEQWFGRDVHAGIGCLSREDHCYEQLVRIRGFELGRRRRVRLGEAAEEFENLVALH
jgi:hypothetical protein